MTVLFSVIIVGDKYFNEALDFLSDNNSNVISQFHCLLIIIITLFCCYIHIFCLHTSRFFFYVKENVEIFLHFIAVKFISSAVY